MKSFLNTAIFATAFTASAAVADDLSGSGHFLCSILKVNLCQSNDACLAVQAADLNIPQFIEVDVKSGKLTTTVASAENRETVASSVSREDGQILIHGYQLGRAFSLLIKESSGQASFASVADGDAVVAFSACTPLKN